MPSPPVAVALAAVGLVMGSFVNVVAHRVPRGVSLVRPPSACPLCEAPIRARDNVPVVSWMMLRGRCRDCGAAISRRYPIVEAATAILFAGAGYLLGVTWVLPAYLWFAAAGVALILTDVDHKRLPDGIVFPALGGMVLLLAAGVALEDQFDWSDLGRGALGAVAYFAFMFLLAELTRGGFGFGDVKAALLLGLAMGFWSWEVVIVGVVLAFLSGGLLAIVLLVLGRRGRKDAIAFGPMLIAGAMAAVVWGADIADWYLRR